MSIGFRNEPSRSIVMLDGVDRVAFNEDGSMELLTPAANPTGNKVMTVSQMPFTKEYVSPELPIVATGAISLNHGLGIAPKLLSRTLVCKIAEYGYSVGDTIDFPGTQDASSAYGLVLVPDATHIFGRYGSMSHVIYVLHKDSAGGTYGITLANWRLIVRAWA